MSADLFAEFASNPPRPHQNTCTASSSHTSTSITGNSIQSGSQADPFNFGFGGLHKGRPPSGAVETWPSLSNNLPGWAPTSTLVPHKTSPNDDDDGWGDFETAEPDCPLTKNTTSFQYSNGLSNPQSQSTPKSRPVRVPSLDLMTTSLVDLGPVDVEPKPSPKPAPKLPSKPAADVAPKSPSKSRFSYNFSRKPKKQQSSVLFDADDFELQGADDVEEEDDDFGGFDAGLKANLTPDSSAAPLVDLLSLDDPVPQTHQPKPRSQGFSQMFGGLGFGATSSKSVNDSRGPPHRHASSLAGLELHMPSLTAPATPVEPAVSSSIFSAISPVKKKAKHESSRSMSALAIWPSTSQDMKKISARDDDNDDEDDDDDGGWGAWDDMPSEKTGALPDTKAPDPPNNWNWNWNLDAAGPQTDTAILKDDDPPPTNIPPPSVILSMFPDLLASANALFQPLSRQSATVKREVLSSPQTAKFLEGYILLATTAARVIAGRKHRWHRDKILAKSMSLSAAGSKGMKLAGVDKTQSAKEEREVADVVAAWQEQVGRLRSAVTAANAAAAGGQGASLRVPEVRESMQVSTARMVPTSPKACIVCGLKRDERIARVDMEVEDSFGEWWAEHWGHRSCKNFWIEHEQRIRQR